MSKELEALDKLEKDFHWVFENVANVEFYIHKEHTFERIDKIRTALRVEDICFRERTDFRNRVDKKLKALEIIKEFIRIGFITISFKEKQNFGEDETAYYVFVNGNQYRCKTKEEYDLLKEVLK